ncbi:MAG: polysaccharide biosynthesis/export family protein [bacterium]
MKTKRKLIIFKECLLIVLILLSLPYVSFGQTDNPTVVDKVMQGQSDYIIGPKDIIEIAVYDEPDLSKTIQLSSDGDINFPLLGEVKLGGLTVSEAEKKLTTFLKKDYLVNPQVNIFVKEYKSKKIYVLGAVKNPGVYELKNRSSLMEMISNAGGLDNTAGKSLILIKSGSLKENSIGELSSDAPIQINLDDLLTEGDIKLNLEVQDGDVLHVPKADSIYVFGQVKTPGLYKLEGKEVSVLQGITMAGGLTRISSPNNTKIIRVEDGHEKTIEVRLKDIINGDKNKDVFLKKGDIVIVPESFF